MNETLVKIERVVAKEPNPLVDDALSNEGITGPHFYWKQADSI
ncbi:hypothetical protein [Alkalibacillus silvisoli]